MKRALLLVGMLLAFDVEAQGAFITGNHLIEGCREYEKGIRLAKAGGCMFYVAGVADVMSMDPVNGFRACVPRSATVNQLTLVTAKFLSQNPELLDRTASSLVAFAFSEAFPCTK